MGRGSVREARGRVYCSMGVDGQDGGLVARHRRSSMVVAMKQECISRSTREFVCSDRAGRSPTARVFHVMRMTRVTRLRPIKSRAPGDRSKLPSPHLNLCAHTSPTIWGSGPRQSCWLLVGPCRSRSLGHQAASLPAQKPKVGRSYS